MVLRVNQNKIDLGNFPAAFIQTNQRRLYLVLPGRPFLNWLLASAVPIPGAGEAAMASMASERASSGMDKQFHHRFHQQTYLFPHRLFITSGRCGIHLIRRNNKR